MSFLIYWVKEAQKLLKLVRFSEMTCGTAVIENHAEQCFTTLQKSHLPKVGTFTLGFIPSSY